MARYLESKCRLCRREQTKLFLKGARCNTDKCAFAKRPTNPGMHPQSRGKSSYYAIQLREKQKVKRIYGILERQFRRFYDVASKAKGATGRTLIQLLERRLDNVVFRSLLTPSRNQARQVVLHGFVFVNGKRVDIPSYLVKPMDIVEVKGKDKVKESLKENVKINSKERSVPSWLDADSEILKMTVVRNPEKEDIGMDINEQLIVELYSK